MDRVRDWTVLVYMSDNNNLCRGAQAMLKQQLAALEPCDRVAVAVEYSHLREPGYTYAPSITHARAVVGTKKLETVEKRPCENMAAPQTLQRFLEWGIRAYPARHYMVILQGHGGSWRASMPDEAAGEEGRPATISVPALGQTLAQVQAETGVRPDVLAFDSCLMSNAEAAYELRDRAGLMLGSEDVISSTPSEYALDYAVPLRGILQRLSDRLADGADASPTEVAKDWVEACRTSWTTPTQTALSFDHLEGIARSVDALAGALLDPAIAAAVIREVAGKARHFSEKARPDRWDRMFDYKLCLRDLADLAGQVAADPRLAAAGPAARGVLQALDEARVAHEAQETVAVEGRTSYGEAMFGHRNPYDADRTHGLSIYLPDNTELIANQRKEGQEYDALAFARDTRWPQLIAKVAEPVAR